MGSRRELVYYGNKLKGKLLSDEDCRVLDSLLKINKEKGYI